jgi:glycosyltransferase involved in cell wall biosynthesis
MRIAHVVLSLGIGGQERLIVRIATALQKRGHDVHIVSLTAGGALRPMIEDTPVHDVLKAERGIDPVLAVRLGRFFRRLDVDVVHTHNASPLIYGAPAGRAAFARVVHTKHGNAKLSRGAKLLTRAASRFVHHFVAVSHDTAAAARKNERPPASRLSVIENGIPLDGFGPDAAARAAIRSELGIPAEALVVGSVGRLVNEKDYPLLVRAMAPLLSETVRLVLVGEGVARTEIEARIASDVDPARRGFVTLAGARHDVPKLLASFDLFAMSSRTEGLPLALPEAMTSRLPIVATAVGGVPSVVPDDVGLLVPHGDPAALRGAIGRLLEDDTTRRRMAERARAYAQGRFSQDKMLEQYLALYAAS